MRWSFGHGPTSTVQSHAHLSDLGGELLQVGCRAFGFEQRIVDGVKFPRIWLFCISHSRLAQSIDITHVR
jgi:hypothetical protein